MYGSDVCRKAELRTKINGLLRESFPGLPPLVDASRFVECRMDIGRCFLTGDDRWVCGRVWACGGVVVGVFGCVICVFCF